MWNRIIWIPSNYWDRRPTKSNFLRKCKIMALPKYNELYNPFLEAIRDGQTYTLKSVRDRIAKNLHLSAEDLAEQLSNQRQSLYANRIAWANTYLKKAGMVEAPRRGLCRITTTGQQLLSRGCIITNELLKQESDAFAAFVRNTPTSEPVASSAAVAQADERTPLETIDELYGTLNSQLADDLLDEIMQQSPAFFEQLVVDLMVAMNYGDGFVTKYSGDDGIDGIIHEDKLGFNLIYIQAKRWQTNITIGKPELQKFAGAMMGPPRIEKGLFITTAKFSQGAKDFANAQHIILVDGQKLTELMVEYNLGVSTQKVYKIKRIDSDYFSDDD